MSRDILSELRRDLPREGSRCVQYTRMAFQMLDTLSGTVSIDRILMTVEGRRHYVLENFKQVYTIGADEISIKEELGQNPPRLSDYVANLFAQAEQARIAGEIR